MGRRGKIVLAFVLLLIGSYFGYRYLYQDHRDILTEASALEIEAEQLLAMFQSNEAPDILNKTITVMGVVTQIEPHSVVLNGSVHCSFDEAIEGLRTEMEVKIKGRCIGYDDLFGEVKLDQCSQLK